MVLNTFMGRKGVVDVNERETGGVVDRKSIRTRGKRQRQPPQVYEELVRSHDEGLTLVLYICIVSLTLTLSLTIFGSYS